MESIEKYREAVENLARLKSPLCFRNSNPHHAAIVMSTIIKTAEKEIRIFDDDLKGDLADNYPELLNAIKYYISQGNSFRIVLKNITNPTSKIYQVLEEFAKSKSYNFQVKLASPEFIASLKKDLKGSFYFTIGDASAVRIQLSYDQRKAYCCFSNPKIALRFINVFDLHFNECENVFH